MSSLPLPLPAYRSDRRSGPVEGSNVSGRRVIDVQAVSFPPGYAFVISAGDPPEASEDVRRVQDDYQNLFSTQSQNRDGNEVRSGMAARRQFTGYFDTCSPYVLRTYSSIRQVSRDSGLNLPITSKRKNNMNSPTNRVLIQQ